jgi:carbon storage regulator CsrA
MRGRLGGKVFQRKESIMLVLTRKVGEVIHIGKDITICVVEIRGSNVRIGVEAPRDLLVLRGELIDGSDGTDEVDRAS